MCDIYQNAVDVFLTLMYDNLTKVHTKTYQNSLIYEKQMLHVFFWTLIPAQYRVEYLNKFDSFENTLVNRFEDSSVIIKLRHSVEDKTIDLAQLYQQLIGYDLAINGDLLELKKNKTNRDNYGAYYTPIKFADLMICHMLDHMGNSPHNVADLSCGSGVFLKQYAKRYLDYFGDTEENKILLSHSLYGIDVDLVALLIAGFEVARIINYVPEHLILGNPLIRCDTSTFAERKVLFYKNMIYDVKMGLPTSFFNQKFDIVLGNPPWEKVRFEERKFFLCSYPEIAVHSLKKDRSLLIEKLREKDVGLYNYYKDIRRMYDSYKSTSRDHPLLHYSMSGELNTYAIFTELAYNMLTEKGRAGLIVKASLFKMPTNAKLVKKLNDIHGIEEIDVFTNKRKIFSIDSREEFCVAYLSRLPSDVILFRSGLETIAQAAKEKALQLNVGQLYKINPSNGLLPNVTSSRELDFLLQKYGNMSTFEIVHSNVKFGRLVHLTNHSKFIHKHQLEHTEPVYEGKFIELYDSRYSGFQGVPVEKRYTAKARSKKIVKKYGKKEIPESRYFIDNEFWAKLSRNYQSKYMLAWRSLTSPTNRRTMISTILPFMPTSQSIQFLVTNSNVELILLNAVFNSIVFDYLVRLKMPGLDLTQRVIKQIPVPDKSAFSKKINGVVIGDAIISLVAHLYHYESRLKGLFPVQTRILKNRKKIIADIDNLVAIAYGIDSIQLKKIASTFPAYYTKGELELYF